MIGISAGNHAQALAWGAAAEGIDASSSCGRRRARRRSPRPGLRRVGRPRGGRPDGSAFDRLNALLAETGRTLVHPFDDPVVLAGAGTVALELLEDAPRGGDDRRAGGRRRARRRNRGRRARPARRSRSSPSGPRPCTRAWRPGKSVPVVPDSIADGLSAPFAGETALAVLRAHDVESVLVTEEEIERGFRFLYARAKLACEPAAAVGVGALLAGSSMTGPIARSLSQEATSWPETASAILGRP